MKPAYRTPPIDWLSVAEAAQLLSVSKVAVYKALNVGRLEFQLIEGRKCVEARNLKARFWGSSQRRVMVPAEPGPDWSKSAIVANDYLDCIAWGPPPWPADRWATLAMVISLAEEGAITES